MGNEEKLRAYLKRVTVDLTQTRRLLAAAEDRAHEPVAIIGMACRYPGGETVEGYWDMLSQGRDGVSEVPASRWNIDDYYDPDPRTPAAMYTRHGAFLPEITTWDAEFFGLSPREALRVDPHHRLLLELTWEGLEDAGASPARVAGSRTAVIIGLMDTLQYGRLQLERQGRDALADPYLASGVSASVAAGRIAYQFNLSGPTLTVDTACSSSLIAVHLAAESLRRGDCDLAIAAGASLTIHPTNFIQACAGGMLCPDGRCKTFDAGADGYVMGEGAGLVVLEPLSKAIANGRRIRAVLRGSAVNQDGRSNGLTAPSRSAQVAVITSALAAAGVSPDDIDHVEAHGSGTHLGDAIELGALHDVFGGRSAERPLRVGAVKTNIGHTQAAAGVAGLIKSVLILENRLIPKTLNLTQPSPAVPADGSIQPAADAVPLPGEGTPRLVGVSSFGLSGTNAHLVLESAPPPEPATAVAEGPHALPISAAGDAAFREHASRLASWLEDHPDAGLADVAHTLRVGRAEHDHRRVLVCDDVAEAVRGLRNAASSGAAARVKGRPRVAFLLPGVGDQYAGLGRELYQAEPVYAAAVDRCVELVGDVDLRPLFHPAEKPAAASGDLAVLLGRAKAPSQAPSEADDRLAHAEVAHPFLFTVEYALAQLLAHRGVRPDALLGYSLGEYVAATLAGVFTLEDALRVVTERARLISAISAGKMVAVAAGEDQVRAFGAGTGNGTGTGIAALNGPSMTVLSGAPDEIDAITHRLLAAGIACRPLRSAHAFHSALLEPAREKLAALIESVPRQAPATTILCNLTGLPMTAEQATSSAYWADQLVSTVRFADAVGHCVEQDIDVFVELGAGQTLGGLVRQNLAGGSGAAVLGTLPASWAGGEPRDARVELLETCSRLWELGVGVTWERVQPGPGRVVSLPAYPFQRTRYWPEIVEGSRSPVPSARLSEPADLCFAPAWQRDPARAAVPADLRLDGSLIVFADSGGVGTALADRAAASGTRVLEVVAGTELRREGRCLVIDPRDPGHYAEVFAAVDGDGPLHVAHLWSLLADDPHAAVGYGFDSLLLAAQAFGDRGVRLLTVTRGATEILGADATAPYRAVTHGLGRALRHEYTGLDWTGVDLDPGAPDIEAAAGQIGCELLLDVDRDDAEAVYDRVSGWRRGRRWLRGWGEVPTVPDPPSPWREDGVYLITGGARGLGMALARHLVRAGVRRLALVGRTALSRDAVTDPDSKAGRSLRDVAELEAGGAEVLLLSADVGVPAELRAALERCRDHFGTLTGVIHAAGLPAGGMAQRRTLADAGAVLAPKVLAMGPLAELVGPETPADQRPELLVLYSSAVTAFGGIGESDYCAANTVLDAYGEALAASAPSTRVVSIAWGPWQHDDWQAESLKSATGLAERVRAYRSRYGFADDAGCALLDRIVAGGHGNVLAVRQPLREVLRDWSAMVDIDALVGATTAVSLSERFPRPGLRTDYAAPRTEPEIAIAEVWGAYLGIDRVGIHDPFFDLGGNSLVGMAMVLAIEKELGVPIAPAVLFEHPTVAEFAAAVAGDAAEGARQALDTSSARGSRRRRARSGTRK
ncbi:type I polyketide synthase [Herbidospora mongoliensis]|uniref:type I polyketide synthase n=1 Tax=Herbidospora mongoliensis TaxID=688067 RepID=UPI0008319639|nr:type I polyketide synthase [Herbidospora mongoliensis]